jgi:hypothetical protein
MLIFLFIVITYSTANLYVFFKLSTVVGLGTFVDVLIGIFVFFMTVSLVLIPIYSNKGSEKSIRIFSLVGYMWVAFLVPFFTVSIILDLYNVVIKYSGSITDNNLGLATLSPYSTFFISLLLSFAINVYGYFEAKNLRVERLVISTSKLPEGVDKLRIAQISDKSKTKLPI